MQNRILISGCSGGGKSTLLSALGGAGHHVVEEPGRRIVRDAMATGDDRALPWVDLAAFAEQAIKMARADLQDVAALAGPVFFDRGLIDAALALEHAAGIPIEETMDGTKHYSDPIFLAPPWPELFITDDERRHDFTAAVDEYDRLVMAMNRLGQETIQLPKTTVAERCAFVLDNIGP